MSSGNNPKWKVRRDSVDPLTITIPGPWRVESPRGVQVYRAPSQRAAYELANNLAGIESLLAWVNRFEPYPALVLVGADR